MKRNAIIRIVLWSVVLVVLLGILFAMMYVPGAGRRLRNETQPAETMVPVPLQRVPSVEDISSGNAIVTGDINVRSAPEADADVVAFAERGTVLQILRQEQVGSKQWGYIGSPTLGWIDMRFVELLEPVTDKTEAATEAPAPLEEGQYNAVVTSEGLNVRTTPSIKSAVAGALHKGDSLQITRQELVNNIAWGYTPMPVNGWVVMEYVELMEPIAENKTVIDVPVQQEQDVQRHGVTLDAASIRGMEIEWAAGSIIIRPTDIQQIYIHEDTTAKNYEQMVWKVREGKVSIQFAENMKISLGAGLNWGDFSKDLIIEVPADWKCDSLEVDAAIASLEVSDLTIWEMEFDGGSGTCVFDNCTVEKLDVNTASGDVRFAGSLQQLDCDAASANIRLELNNVPRSLDLDTASGDLDVTLPEDAGFTVTMDALSSDFTSDFETTSRNGSFIAGNGRCRIDVDAMSGDVTIRKAS